MGMELELRLELGLELELRLEMGLLLAALAAFAAFAANRRRKPGEAMAL